MSVRSRQKLRVLACVLGLLMLSLAMLPSCATPAPRPPVVKVTIAPTTFPASAPIYVAAEKGFFRDEGLDASVRQHEAGSLALRGVLDGTADFATVADVPVARAVLDTLSPTIVGEIAEVEGADLIVARRDRGIATGTDLKGKRIGVLPDTSADFFLHIYLVTSGVDPATVTRVPLTADTLVSALASGSVDAISAYAPYTFDAEDALGANAVVFDQPILYATTWNVVVRAGYDKTHQDVIARFLRAVDRAEQFIAAHPAEAQAITAKNTGISVERLRKLWPTNRWALELDQALILTLEDEARWMSGNATPPDFLQRIDTKPLSQVRPEAVTIVQPGN